MVAIQSQHFHDMAKPPMQKRKLKSSMVVPAEFRPMALVRAEKTKQRVAAEQEKRERLQKEINETCSLWSST